MEKQKNRLSTFLLWLFFGVVSAHRFYVGKTGTAVLQILTFGGFGFWLLIDGIMIITGEFKDKSGNKLSAWY